MTRQLALQANLIDTNNTERWLSSMAIGRTLNVCCGTSSIGEVMVDTDVKL